MSRVSTAVYRTRAFALGAASEGRRGGYRSLMATRQVLELGLNAFVQPEMVSVAQASKAYDENGDLTDPGRKGAQRAFQALIDNSRRYLP